MTESPGLKLGLWSPRRVDALPILGILLIPLLITIPELTGIFKDNPILTNSGLGIGVTSGILPGSPYIDPNAAFTTQALGRLSAELWLHFHVPWWNDYSGVGMPLAGEFQPAAFSPVNLFLLLPHGVLLRHLFMQYIAGLGMYCFTRQIGLSPISAVTGGLLFAQNGALAWFQHAPPDPASFLPWMLLGVERAAVYSTVSRASFGGWRLLGLATGAMILAGFPETAFICGQLVLVYFLWRTIHCPALSRWGMIRRAAGGGLVGLALAAPQMLAFAEFLPAAMVGGHNGVFGEVGLSQAFVVPSFLAPYIYGPIFAYHTPTLDSVWDNIGGYCDLLMLTAAIAGFAARRDSLAWVLSGWIVLCTLKTFAVQPVLRFWNVLPGMKTIAFYRYAPASMEFAVILLACFAVEQLLRKRGRNPLMLAAGISTFVIGSVYGFSQIHALSLIFAGVSRVFDWAILCLAWMAASSICALVIIGLPRLKFRAELLSILLIFDATVMFAIPSFSTPRHGKVDLAAVSFLQSNIGLQRFYTLGPIGPNYGAYFQIASINHNYSPVPTLWTNHVKEHLDPGADAIEFVGYHLAGQTPDALTVFKSHLSAFTALGVKYLVVPTGMVAFRDAEPAFHDQIITIFALPNPAAYFDTVGSECHLQIKSRYAVIADCPKAAVLLRRELFFVGWHAVVNGRPAQIKQANGLFQSITIPAGTSRVTFFFAPLYVNWAWAAFWIALIILAGSWIPISSRRLRSMNTVIPPGPFQRRSAALKPLVPPPGEGRASMT